MSKNFIVVIWLILEYLVCGFFMMKTTRDKKVWRQNAIRYVAKQCRRLLIYIRLEVSYKFSRPDLFANGKKYFMVCNHMSYLDILFLSAGEPAVFVTSVEMKETPFLGELSLLGGSYFVERRNRHKIPKEIQDLAQLMKEGFHIFVFPEATSTDGMNVLPFKKSMFKAAVAAGFDVLPVCLRYEEINGDLFSYKNKDQICWYGKMPFTPHFLRVMGLRSAKISVEYLDPISSREFPDRSLLADKAYEQITNAYFKNRPANFTS